MLIKYNLPNLYYSSFCHELLKDKNHKHTHTHTRLTYTLTHSLSHTHTIIENRTKSNIKIIINTTNKYDVRNRMEI